MGDVNANGFDDILISAPFADSNNQQNAGETYLIFGKENFNPSFNLSDINGSNGIVLNGIGSNAIGRHRHYSNND